MAITRTFRKGPLGICAVTAFVGAWIATACIGEIMQNDVAAFERKFDLIFIVEGGVAGGRSEVVIVTTDSKFNEQKLLELARDTRRVHAYLVSGATAGELWEILLAAGIMEMDTDKNSPSLANAWELSLNIATPVETKEVVEQSKSRKDSKLQRAMQLIRTHLEDERQSAGG